jgi:hypothetical protein
VDFHAIPRTGRRSRKFNENVRRTSKFPVPSATEKVAVGPGVSH